MAELLPRYRNVPPVTGFASSQVNAGHFVKLTGDKTDQGDYPVAHCGLGDPCFGVAERDSGPTTLDANSVERRIAINRNPTVSRVVPGASITAGQKVQSDSIGRAIPLGAAVAAALDTGVVGSNNAITWTARTPGAGGNAITVTLVDPGGTSATLSVDVAENGHDITVNLGRASSAINSTAQNVMDAIEANGEANALVSVVDKSTSSGTGLVAAVSKTNLATGSDPEGNGTVLGTALMTVLSSDPFVEIDPA